MEHFGVFGVLSAINGSKNGSKFGRGEPFVWFANSAPVPSTRMRAMVRDHRALFT
jgi:hypothetical protein